MFDLNSVGLGEVEPIGFLIHRAVADLRLAIRQLEMDRAHGTRRARWVRRELIQSAEELLLAFQLIVIPQLTP